MGPPEIPGFTSEPETNSLGAEVLKQINAPPVLVTVLKRERVLLQGEELHSYMRPLYPSLYKAPITTTTITIVEGIN